MFQENQEIIKILFSSLFVIVVIITLIITFIIFYSKKQELLYSEINYLKSRFEKEILKTQLEIQEETSNKISREIHDNISLGLTLSKLQINNFIESNPVSSHLLTSSVELITKSLIDLNDISKSLDSSQLFSHGLISVLEAEAEVIRKSKIFDVLFEAKGDIVYLDAETELIILRIFQEACNNIIKHAKANTITIDLFYENKYLDVKITDNGIGFDVEGIKLKKEIRKMAGIKNIYQRAELIGAETNIYSTPNIGTTVHIKIPLKKQHL